MTVAVRAGLSLVLCLAWAVAEGTESISTASADADPLVVSQGEARIHLSDIDARLSRVPKANRGAFMDSPKRIEQMLNGMLLAKQLAAQARGLGLDADPAIAAEMRLAQDEVLAKHRLRRLTDDIEMPDMAGLAYERYLASPALYVVPEAVNVRHFLIKRDIHGDDNARAKAEALRQQFINEGGDFADFVKVHSEEPNAEQHAGILQGVERGKMVRSFEDAAFALEKPGELSPVVSTRFGYHVIQLLAKREAKRQSFDEVREQIEKQMRDEHVARVRQQHIDQLRGKELEASPELVQSLRTRYFPDGAPSHATGLDADTATPDAGAELDLGSDE
jgi:peptidyl-prolyl cis-trans isomerase C